jgi:hypothetical protein
MRPFATNPIVRAGVGVRRQRRPDPRRAFRFHVELRRRLALASAWWERQLLRRRLSPVLSADRSCGLLCRWAVSFPKKPGDDSG